MIQRFLVIYYDGNENRAKLIDDTEMRFPFGVDESMVGDDCASITAIIRVVDATTVPEVVIDDQPVTLEEPTQP
jgi:hypothetical protein